MMNYLKKTTVILLLTTLVSCGGVNADAKKAAKLTNKSIENTSKLKLEAAEKDFKKSQEIIQKYTTHKKKERFFELYIQYRDKDKKSNPEMEK